MSSIVESIIRNIKRSDEKYHGNGRYARNLFPIKLDEKFDTVDTPEGLRGINLFAHQQVVVKALIDLENNPSIEVNSSRVTSNAILLSEPFGTGKTIEILALIVSNMMPKPRPMMNMCGRSLVCSKYIGRGALLRQNLIVVGSSVVIQWQNAIQQFTSLKPLVVGNYHQLVAFKELHKNRALRNYDIVILKCGSASGDMDFLGPTGKDIMRYHIINAVCDITAGQCWARVIYDDFDVINIPSNVGTIPALSTIYVSASSSFSATGRSTPSITDIQAALTSRGTIMDMAYDNALHQVFNVRTDQRFTEQSTKMPIINIALYEYKNPNEKYIGLIKLLDQNDLVEMLNGDALGTAAESLGVKTKSVADIFSRVLDNNYAEYSAAIKTIQYLDNMRAHCRKLEHGDVTDAQLEKLKKAITKHKPYRLATVSEDCYNIIGDAHDIAVGIKTARGAAIDRVMSNLREGVCQVCCLPLEESNVFIMKCCGVIVCDQCGIRGSNLRGRGRDLRGNCNNCNVNVRIDDFIFIDKSYKVENLLNAGGIETEEFVKTEEPPVETPEPEVDDVNPKVKALYDIIHGKKPANGSPIRINMRGLANGTLDIPPGNTARKVLIFASFNETIEMIETALSSEGISYKRLHGTYQEKARIVEEFRDKHSVLLVNSRQHCAGLNIQFATDLVYFHLINDGAVEAQVAGRAQRIGRTCNLNIHYIAYQNEAAEIRTRAV